MPDFRATIWALTLNQKKILKQLSRKIGSNFQATTWVHNEIATKDTTVKGTNNHAYINEIEKLSLETTKFT